MTVLLDERYKFESQIVEKALKDDAFRQQLISNPRAAIAQATGITIPQDIQIEVLQETKSKAYLVLPVAASALTPISTADVGSGAGCSSYASTAVCAGNCTQCGNNETSCQPGDSEG